MLSSKIKGYSSGDWRAAYGGDDGDNEAQPQPDQHRKKTETQGLYDPHSRYQVIGLGTVTAEQAKELSSERRAEIGR
jgi:hypothetical protein